MQIISVDPRLRIAALFWQPRRGEWTLTTVAKLTFELAPGPMRFSRVPEPIYEEDGYWEDEPTASLAHASDLVPFKPRVDVVLVGCAYAPRGTRVRSLLARMSVGAVDKAIEVFGGRAVMHDRSRGEGRTFAKMPLRYERAAGGPGTSNPVGVPYPGPPDARGFIPIPSFQPPGFGAAPVVSFPPIGFGPIAPTWPERVEKIALDVGWWHDAWRQHALPSRGLDPGYFNVAPADQQMDRFQGDEEIALFHLHPDHPEIRARFPSFAVRLLDRRGIRRTAACDTVWIDTARRLVTLTFRARTEIQSPLDDVSLAVVIDEAGELTTWDVVQARATAGAAAGREEIVKIDARDLRAQWGVLASNAPPGPSKQHDTALLPSQIEEASREEILPNDASASDDDSAAPDETMTLVGIPATGPAMPFTKPADTAPPPELKAPSPSFAGKTVGERVAESRSAMNAVSISGDIPKPPLQLVATPAGDMTKPPLQLAATPAGDITKPPFSPIAAPQGDVASKVVRAGDDSLAARAGRRRMGKDTPSRPPPVQSVLALSNAAAGVVEAAPSRRAPEPAPVNAPSRPTKVLELVWFDATLPSRLRAHARYKKTLSEAKSKRGEGAEADRPKEERDRRDVLEVLKRAPLLDEVGLTRALDESVEDGVLTPPLVVVEGDLELLFDEVEALKATIAAVSPFVASDRKLKESFDNVVAVLPHVQTAHCVAEALTSQLRAAFLETKRAVPADHLDRQVEQILMRGRHFREDGTAALRRLVARIRLTDKPPPRECMVASTFKEAWGARPRTARIRALTEIHRATDHQGTAALTCFAVSVVV